MAVSLSTDAFAVALCKGLALKKINFKNCATVGLWFGAFQGLMPMIGYFAGSHFASYVQVIDHWVAFILLGFIGYNMIKEAVTNTLGLTEEVKTRIINKVPSVQQIHYSESFNIVIKKENVKEHFSLTYSPSCKRRGFLPSTAQHRLLF